MEVVDVWSYNFICSLSQIIANAVAEGTLIPSGEKQVINCPHIVFCDTEYNLDSDRYCSHNGCGTEAKLSILKQ